MKKPNVVAFLLACLGRNKTTRRTSWMNIYAQGYYHRQGKANTLNAHPGDLYDTEMEARADIDPDAPYIATVSFQWDAPDWVEAYPEDSKPVPLGVSRKKFLAVA